MWIHSTRTQIQRWYFTQNPVLNVRFKVIHHLKPLFCTKQNCVENSKWIFNVLKTGLYCVLNPNKKKYKNSLYSIYLKYLNCIFYDIIQYINIYIYLNPLIHLSLLKQNQSFPLWRIFQKRINNRETIPFKRISPLDESPFT